MGCGCFFRRHHDSELDHDHLGHGRDHDLELDVRFTDRNDDEEKWIKELVHENLSICVSKLHEELDLLFPKEDNKVLSAFSILDPKHFPVTETSMRPKRFCQNTDN